KRAKAQDTGVYVDLDGSESLVDALNAAVKAGIAAGYIDPKVDKATIQAASKLARVIDSSDEPKVLYLLPHLAGLLRDLYCTPLARLGPAKAKTTGPKKTGKLSTLRDGAANEKSA